MGFFSDYLTAQAIDSSPAYAQQKEREQVLALQQQQAQREAAWVAQNRDKLLGQQGQPEQLGLPSNMPTLQTQPAQPGTGAYADNVDPMQRHMMERNFELMASGMPLLSQGGQANMQSMQNSAMTGINQLGLEKWKKNNLPTKLDALYSNIDVDNQGRQWGLNKQTNHFEQIPVAGGQNVSFTDPTSGDSGTANIQDMNYWMGMPDNTEEQRQAKALMRNAISKGNILDRGTSFYDIATGQSYNKDLLGVKTQEGEGKYIVDTLEAYPSTVVKAESFVGDLDMTINELQELKALTNGKTVGWASLMDEIPETDANRWRLLRDTITSRFALDKMMELKNASPTGSTGFGALNEKEMKVMQDYMGNLTNSQSAQQMRATIDKIEKLLASKRSSASQGLKESQKWYEINAPIYRPNTYRPSNEAPAGAGGWSIKKVE